MNTRILPSLENLRRYLSASGWHAREHPNDRIQVFESDADPTGDYASVVIPRSTDLRDARELIADAVRLIASFEKVEELHLATRVQRWDRDIFRARFMKILGHEETLPLEIAAEAVSGLKQFIGYAAYTHTNPKPFFDKVGSISADFARNCQFGHTFHGSFGLTIECPLAVSPGLPMDGIEPFIPLERQVFERVANGLLMLRDSVDQDSIEPLLGGYLVGLNANMCRVLADIYEKADGRRIEYDLSWSPQMQSSYERVWRPVVFEGRAYDVARIAAAELERAETFPETRIEGRIVVLKSEMPPGLDEQSEFEHIITMFWEREKGQVVKVRVPLSPTQYIKACDAHKEGRAIRVFGIPEKSGKFWTLTKAHGFTTLPG